MMTVRPSQERGHTRLGWLDSRHTFSFDQYFDPRHTHFRALRVLNEDWVAPGAGFPMHPHRDMEILTYLLEGALEHKDSIGNGSVIRPGEVQRMTAGSGVLHSEFNASPDERAHLLQIWILPEQKNLPPGYEQKAFPREQMENRWLLLASREGGNGALTIHQDVAVYAARLRPGASLRYAFWPGRHGWLQVAGGLLEAEGTTLHAGDGAAISDQPELALRVPPEAGPAEVLLFDLA